MKISLNEFVRKHYKEIDYCGEFMRQANLPNCIAYKKYIACGVDYETAQAVAKQYDNLLAIDGRKGIYAPIRRGAYITLKGE